jgi:uncharacterized protein YbjT (DUF2867 family)
VKEAQVNEAQVNEPQEITVLGGTGFLGQHVVRHLAARRVAVRVATRHAERRKPSAGGESCSLKFVRTEINDDASVRAAIAGAFGVVNAVSLYMERGRASFEAIHVEAAARLARHARDTGVERLVHVSGIGADPQSAIVLHPLSGEGRGGCPCGFSCSDHRSSCRHVWSRGFVR